MTIPQQPPDQEIPPSTPIDTPPDPTVEDEPEFRTPGVEEPPMRMPRDNPDVETEL